MKRQAVPSVSSSYLNIRSPRNQEKLQRQKSTEKRTESLIMACHNAKYRFYRRQSTAELSQFALQRGVLDSASSDREQLLALLNQADDDFRFDLLGLPAELRNNVYRLAIQDHEPLRCQTHRCKINPPPLTQVSKIVRSESLRIFYQACRLPILKPLYVDDEKPSMPMLWVHDCSSEVIELLRSLVVE